MGKKYAIMVIDIQNSTTRPGNPKLTPKNQKEVSNIAAFLKDMPTMDKYIVTYQDDSNNFGRTSDEKILDAIDGHKNVIFFEKKTTNAFGEGKEVEDFGDGKKIKYSKANIDLAKHLKKNGITDLVIMGLNQSACVLSTIRGAIDKSFHVTISNDTVFSASEDDKGPTQQKGPGSGRYTPSGFFKQQVKQGNITIVDTAEDIKKIINGRTSALDTDYNSNDPKEYFVLKDDDPFLVAVNDLVITDNIVIAPSTAELEPDEYSL